MKNKTKSTSYSTGIRSVELWWKISPRLLISSVLSNLLEALRPLLPIYIVGRLVDELSYGGNVDVIRRITSWLVFTIFILGLLTALVKRMNTRENYLIRQYLLKLYSDKFLDMDYELIDDSRVQEMYSHIMQANNWSGLGLRTSLSIFNSMSKSVFLILGSLILSLRVFFLKVDEGTGLGFLNSSWFNLAFIILLLSLVMIIPRLNRKRAEYMDTIANESKFRNRFFFFFSYEMLLNLKRAADIRLYNQERLSIEAFKEETSFTNSSMAILSRGKMGIYGSITKGIASLVMGLIFLYVGIKSWGSAFGVGSFTQYTGALISLSMGIISFVEALGNMKMNSPFLESTFEFLDLENVKYQGSLTVEKRSDRKYEVEFRNVSFKYPSSDNWAIRNLSLKFNIGERLAIVGSNGSGKTSLVKLLCRLYDPTEGEILLNGIDIRKYDYREYMSIFSIVFQDFKLISLPMGENIGVAREYNRERVEKVLEDAGLDMDKGNFHQGLDTYLYRDIADDGVEISGGEAQKIAIARALYDDAPFIILDEPTASLDPIAESEIYEQFNSIIGDRTAIFISHRLSSCKFADRILVFDRGSLIEEGSHDSLLLNEFSKYYELWESQAKYYR